MRFCYPRKIQIRLLLVGFIFFTGCAHVGTNQDNSQSSDIPLPKTLTEVLQQDQGPKKPTFIQNGQIIVQGIKLKNTQFDIPITINSRVEYWIDYFCGRGRGYFGKYLERSEYFVPYIVPLLRQNGLPEDLVYLAMIESGFNNLARSRAKAVGPWQFISATGKRYGLAVNWWVDERRDTGKATLAAVGYLRDLYNMFQNWELAAASYNAGEAKVARAIRRFGSKDFWVIARHRFLKPETRDYVPKIIAAALIAKNRTQFGFPASPVRAHPDEAVASDGELVKLVKSDRPLDSKEDKDLSEKDYKAEKDADLSKGVKVAGSGSDDDDFATDDDDSSPSVTVAQTTVSGTNEAPISTPSNPSAPAPLARPIPTPHVSKTGVVGGEELADFEVQSPADLLKVARAAGLSYSTVKSLNPEILRWCTPPTAGTYRIKLPAFAKDKFLATYNHGAFPRKVQFMTYKVHRGDTLTRIARHFGIRVDPMSDLNRISPRVPLQSGTHVLLPMPNDRSRTFVSLEVRDPPEHKRQRHRRTRHRNYRASYVDRSVKVDQEG